MFLLTVVGLNLSGENSLSIVLWLEVFLVSPGVVLSPVFSSCPLPHHSVDEPVDLIESLFADDVAMVVSPPSDDRVQLHNQVTGASLSVGFYDCSYLAE